MNFFEGYQLIECEYCADWVQSRKHKKKRINKKWRKRYGMKEVPWRKFIITNDRQIFGHPLMMARLKEQLALEGLLNERP